MINDRRLIEDYLPIEAISAEASREKSVRKGHISTLHLWWARRPLVACRAAVYGALVPATRFVPENGPENKKRSLGRANAARFVERLCKYPGDPRVIAEAQKHILEGHAERLTWELKAPKAGGAKLAWVEEFKFSGERVTVEDIELGRAPRPRVLDMFAGGGGIPLEALRLGCEAYALDLNPVAHIIELCTLIYPQKYGKPDPNARGITGPKDKKGKITWGGLENEVRYWGEWVLRKVKAEIGDLYPLIPDPEINRRHAKLIDIENDEESLGYLIPLAYIWTRTVRCKNPACSATVPLLRQTWLRKKKSPPYIALKPHTNKEDRRVKFKLSLANSENGFDFDPAGFSSRGNASCLLCGTVADLAYIKQEGWENRIGRQLIAIVGVRSSQHGKVYLAADEHTTININESTVKKRLVEYCRKTGLTTPEEPIANLPANSPLNTLGITVRPYGIRSFADLYTSRQLLTLLTFCNAIVQAHAEMLKETLHPDHALALTTSLALVLDKMADYSNMVSRWGNDDEGVANAFSRQVLTMVWDFAEAAPWSGMTGSWQWGIGFVADYYAKESNSGLPARCIRGSATSIDFADASFDAIITDPPYYDNVPYSDISDLFYVWLKRTIGSLYPGHLAGKLTPKKQEAIADADRHEGDWNKARLAYEAMMQMAFKSAHRSLKPNGALTVVYAHKTTLGWATLVDALRRSGFIVTEAWPLDTESKGRLRSHDSSALASSIFLVARKREGQDNGQYETEVRPELEQIIRERVSTLWEIGISGADLVIACVGAGLRAFTRFANVEYANGEPVPSERFLSEVESVVLDQIFARLSKEVGGNGGRYSLAGVDPATQFYILWRFTYRMAELDAGEAIVFANGTHVELDGPGSLTYGARALVEKKKGKYRMRDFRERGEEEKLGLPADNGSPAPLIDALHRTLWLLRNRPLDLPDFLRKSGVNREQMRLVAQALAGPALKGGELGEISPTSELSALSELTANWRSVVEYVTLMPLEREARRTGQKALDFEKEKKK